MQCIRYRVPPDQPVSAALLQVTFEKKTPVKESQVGKTDEDVGHPKDEQPLAAPIHHHPVPPIELPHPFVETVDVLTAPAMTAKQELLLSLDSSPASKVCNIYVHVNTMFLHKKLFKCSFTTVEVLQKLIRYSNKIRLPTLSPLHISVDPL